MGPAVSYLVPFEIQVKDGRYRYMLSNIQGVAGNVTVNYDDALRKNPKRVQKAMEKTYSENEYKRYMKASEPFTSFIATLKQAMAAKEPGKDF